ncbi:MAG: radical SAM protein [Nitrospirae bacterium]|nr:radical SAM protein [Nitrospirota bacterium]
METKLKRYRTITRTAIKAFILNRHRTVCPMLWDSVFIDQCGNVFTCCHYLPGILGNIYSQNLSEIWTKDTRLRLYRWMSLNRCLHCFNECTLLSDSQKASTVSSLNSLRYPKKIRILFGEFCNISCIMCDQEHRSKVVIDNDMIKRNVDFSLIEDIDFQGGEILAMKNAREMYLWLTKELNKKVNLITNGILINDDWADHLVRGSNWIQISVNASTKETHEIVNKNSNFTRVIDNIKKLIHLKNQYGLDVKIVYKFTIVSENIQEISEAIALADYLGCDQIAFGYDTSIPHILQDNKSIKEAIKTNISLLKSSKLKVDIERKRLEQLGLL